MFFWLIVFLSGVIIGAVGVIGGALALLGKLKTNAVEEHSQIRRATAAQRDKIERKRQQREEFEAKSETTSEKVKEEILF